MMSNFLGLKIKKEPFFVMNRKKHKGIATGKNRLGNSNMESVKQELYTNR